MYVVFVHGPAAAGKFTIGKRVAERLGIRLFHNHLVVDAVAGLFDFGTQEFNALREAYWLRAFSSAAHADQSFVFTFAPEATVADDLVSRLEAAVVKAGGRVHYVELCCSDAEIRRRLGDASRSRFGKLNDVAVYDAVKNAGGFAYPNLPEPLVSVDTETCEPEVAAERIVTALETQESV